MGLSDWSRRIDDRVQHNLSADRPASGFERWVAAGPGRAAAVGAVTAGLVAAAVVELTRPHPQLDNFLLWWLLVGGISFGLFAVAARVTASQVAHRDEVQDSPDDPGRDGP